MPSNKALWVSIRDYRLPFRPLHVPGQVEPEVMQSFEEYLCEKEDWTTESASRITEEYRRYLYLKALDGGPLTPPEVVDRAWHLHQSFAQDYNENLCHKTLGCDIPHLTDLSRSERWASYARLHQMYKTEFGLIPPSDIWLSPTKAVFERILRAAMVGGFALFFVGGLLSANYGEQFDWMYPVGMSVFVGGIFLPRLLSVFGFKLSPAKIGRCA